MCNRQVLERNLNHIRRPEDRVLYRLRAEMFLVNRQKPVHFDIRTSSAGPSYGHGSGFPNILFLPQEPRILQRRSMVFL